MSFINPSTKQINLKIIYFGPALSGKSTTLKVLARKLNGKRKKTPVKLADRQAHTAFFDFLPLSLGKTDQQQLRAHLYAVPGPIFYKANCRLLFKGIDGIVFVADSQLSRLEENLACLSNLEEYLHEQEIFYEELPVVFQYNKRDLRQNITPIATLNDVLNPDKRPVFETVAKKGEGILEPLEEVTRRALMELQLPE